MEKLGCSLGVDIFGIQLNVQRYFSFLTCPPTPRPPIALSCGEDSLEEGGKNLKRKLKGDRKINCIQFGERVLRPCKTKANSKWEFMLS